MTEYTPRVSYLKSLPAVRETTHRVLDLALSCDGLDHWRVDLSRLESAADLVLSVKGSTYGDMRFEDLPYHSRWRHFEAGKIARLSELLASLDAAVYDRQAILRLLLDLAVVAVLLDAGAGAEWRYVEAATGLTFSRSEGLGVAAWHMFCAGLFSSDPARDPYRVDAAGLARVTRDKLAAGMQVSPSNPLVGLEGRLALLHNLGSTLAAQPHLFAPPGCGGANASAQSENGMQNRPGCFLDALGSQEISIQDLWRVVSQGFADVWPRSRSSLDGVNLGDVWVCPALVRHLQKDHDTGDEKEKEAKGMVAFHKLSQWLTYSLLEVLEVHAGMRVVGAAQQMTGLAEYRNGGLLVDMGVIVPRETGALAKEGGYEVHSPFVIEWRALTVALLDRLATRIREKVGGLSEEQLPLAKILEAGTWAAGRVCAWKRSPETGNPPFKIISDGTVF
eukprot:ANDGO_03443.mRNA.1 Uracil catabolism protein 4